MRPIDADSMKLNIKHNNYNNFHNALYEVLIEWIDKQPTAIIYCKDCKHHPIDNRTKEDSSNFNIEFPDGKCPCQCDDGWYSWYPEDDWFCGNGELREEISCD